MSTIEDYAKALGFEVALDFVPQKALKQKRTPSQKGL